MKWKINQKWKKASRMFLVMALTVMCGIAGTGVTAYANVDEAAVAAAEEETQPETQPEPTTEPPAVIEEEPADNNFSVPGNAEVLDDITDGSSKEFLTIRTANNNTFYLIIDRSTNSQNVYMLSTIDETDLKDFIEEEPETEPEKKPEVIIEEEPKTEVEEELPKEEPKGKNASGLILIALLAAGGAGAYYFFKIKPKKEEDLGDSENLELGDGLETINEDEQDE